MKNISFALFLREEEGSKKNFYKIEDSWVTPDDIWGDGNDRTFIYNGDLYVDMEKGKATHIDMLQTWPELKALLYKKYGEMPSDYLRNLPLDRRKETYLAELALQYRSVDGLKEALIGRTINVSKRQFSNSFIEYDVEYPSSVDWISVVTFWNKDSEVYRKLLKGCIDALRKKGLMRSEIFISTPILGLRHISNLGAMKVQLSAEEERKVDLHQRLHLMSPNEKKDAMEKLGLVSGDDRGMERKKWQSGMRDLGMPGYMTQSESFYVEGSFINPNELFTKCIGGNCVTFFFMEGELLKFGGDETHYHILAGNPSLSERVEKITGLSGIFMRAKLDESKSVILGRMGKFEVDGREVYLISLWNKNLDEGDIRSLLERMIRSGDMVEKNGDLRVSGLSAYVSSREISGYAKDVISGLVKKKEMSDDEKEKLDLHRGLHLMTGVEKKDAMEKLGLSSGSSYSPMEISRRNWTRGMRDIGMPGYMTQSECVYKEGAYINPDLLWKSGSYTFIYSDNDLYLANDYGLHQRATHIDLIIASPELREKVQVGMGSMSAKDVTNNYGLWNKVRKYRIGDGMDEMLFGRVFEDGWLFNRETGEKESTIISFWNDLNSFGDEVKNCVKKIMDKGIMDKKLPVFISSANTGTIPLSEFMSYGGSGEMSDEDKEKQLDLHQRFKEKLDLHQKLHLMHPNEKKDAMEKLGLVSGHDRGGVRKKWQSGMRDIGMPGYMTQSENSMGLNEKL
jgi:hypothetical protein